MKEGAKETVEKTRKTIRLIADKLKERESAQLDEKENSAHKLKIHQL